MNTMRITATLWVAGLRSGMEYRVNFIVEALMGLAWQGVGFAMITVVLARFESIAGWTAGEVAFLYGLRMMALALCGFGTGRIWWLQYMVRNGTFDSLLIRPVPPLLQLLTADVPLSSFGELAGGAALIFAAARMMNFAWTPLAVLYLALAAIGGGLILLAIRLLLVSFTFRLLMVDGLMGIFDNLFNEFGTYPLSIFDSTLRALLTFVVPVAFMAYLPATVLLQRTTELQMHALIAVGAPLAGVAWLALAVWVFKREMRNYASSGH